MVTHTQDEAAADVLYTSTVRLRHESLALDYSTNTPAVPHQGAPVSIFFPRGTLLLILTFKSPSTMWNSISTLGLQMGINLAQNIWAMRRKNSACSRGPQLHDAFCKLSENSFVLLGCLLWRYSKNETSQNYIYGFYSHKRIWSKLTRKS